MVTYPSTFDQIDGTGLDRVEAHLLAGKLPAHILADSRRGLCWDAAHLQWLCTELSSSLRNGVLTGIELPSAQELQVVRDSLAGTAISLLPVEFFNKDEANSIVALRSGLVEQQDTWPDLASEGAAHVACADHLLRPTPRGKIDPKRIYTLPHRLYPAGPSKPAEWASFRTLISDLVRAVCARPAEPVWHEKSYETALPTILHELFKNTHDHARTDSNGSALKFSLRGISCRYFGLHHFDYIKKQGASVVLDPGSVYVREFFDAKRKDDNFGIQCGRILGFLELSIFDSGPGLVGKVLGKDPRDVSAIDQLEIVRDCLSKGFSSTDNESRGYGLSKVLSRLRRSRGFIRIRTNSVSGYRSFARFSSLGQRMDGEAPDDRLFDWKTLYSPKQSAYRSLKGTTVTVLIPMGEVNEEPAHS